jgi:3-oxoacyl-[acyl-carrier-protein] synthase III
MGITLSRPAVYLPEDVISNPFLETIIDTSDEWITEMSGIKERRISLELGIKEMGAIAAKRCLEQNMITDQEINEIIFATNFHDHDLEVPMHASHVAKELGIEKAALSDIGAGCTGLVYAIRQAYNNMSMEPHLKRVLVVGGERLTGVTDYSDRSTCFLFGDGAGAYLLERWDNEEGIIKNVCGGQPDVGDGKGFASGFLSQQRKIGLELIRGPNGNLITQEAEKNYLTMKGNPIFKYAVKIMRHAIHEVLEDTDYTLEDVDLIIPHGANKRIIDSAGFGDKAYYNLDKYGNTSTASIPAATVQAYEEGKIKKGSLIINVGFGAGFTWGANLSRSLS